MNREQYLAWCEKWGMKPDVINVAGKEVATGPGVGKRAKEVLQKSHDDFVAKVKA